jgi:hypothetical protein
MARDGKPSALAWQAFGKRLARRAASLGKPCGKRNLGTTQTTAQMTCRALVASGKGLPRRGKGANLGGRNVCASLGR